MEAYWFGSGTPTYLINMMRKYDFLPSDLGETIYADKRDFDAATETMTTIYVMELKFNKTAQEALDQINGKHYVDAFKMKGKEIVKVGMNFALENDVNTLTWVI